MPQEDIARDEAVTRVGAAMILAGAEKAMSQVKIWQVAEAAVERWGPDEAVARSAAILHGPGT